jgi:hydrogenase maturation protein HypF
MKTVEIKLPFKLKKAVLALGSQTKNTVCFAENNRAWVSPVHKDLSEPRDLSAFEKDVKYFLRGKPKIIAYDLHPEYQSSRLALLLSAKHRIKPVQHHHAHIASCMIENGLKNQKIIGVAFDGTGLGVDNTLWGAEFLLCDYNKFLRAAHLKEIPLVGGERAILEPVRLLAAWLDFDKAIDKKQIFKKIYHSGINSPLCSSMGRLFDAAASLILRKRKASFEAELALELEKSAAKDNSKTLGYKFKIIKSKDGCILDPSNIFRRITRDMKAKNKPGNIARSFHQSVAGAIVNTCLVLREDHGVNKVVLSGGVFQNKLLMKMSLDSLSGKGFQVFTHKYLSCNDSGISLGQAVVAGCGS